MNTDYCVVYCTTPDSAIAEQIAKNLIELSLAACINIVPHLTSIYPWEGKIVKGCESLMMIKTHKNKLPDLEKAVLEAHPYDFPEFIVMPIIHGNTQYLQWVGKIVG